MVGKIPLKMLLSYASPEDRTTGHRITYCDKRRRWQNPLAAFVVQSSLSGSATVAPKGYHLLFMNDYTQEVRSFLVVAGWMVAALFQISVAGAQTVQDFLNQIRDGDAEKRQAAMRSLRTFPPDDAVVLALVEGLKDKSDANRATAAYVLGQFSTNAPIVVPALTDLLDDRNVRGAAATALAGFGPAALPALPKLAALLDDPDMMLRHAVVQALGGFARQSPEAVRLIETRLEDDSPYVRNAAVTALGGLGPSSQQHLAQFISALSDASEQVRSAGARAIGALGAAGAPALPALLKASRTSQSESLFFLKPVIGQFGKEEPARVVPLLVAAMNDHANSVSGRIFAAETLGWIGARAASALPDLQKTSTDGPDQLRRAAGDAMLTVIPDTLESSPEGLSRAIQMLADDNRAVRDRGAVALTHAGGRAVPLLLETLRQDTRDRVRIATIQTLSGICQAASSATPVIQQVANSDGSMELRNAAIYALGYMSDCLPASKTAPVVETLTGALGIASLRLAAIESLGHMHGRGAAAIPAIRETLERALSTHPRDDRTVLPCLAALGAIGPPAQTAAAQVLPLLGDPDPAIRSAALGALGGMPVQEAVTSLIKAMHDPLDAVRDSAGRSIRMILSTSEGQAYRPTIVPALVAQMKDPEYRVREAVLSALVASQAGEAVQAVIGALSDSSNVVRWEAAGGLAAFFQNPGDRWIKEAALPALIRSLGDPDGRVAMYAALSLKACGAVCVSALPALRQALPHADSLASRAITDAIEALEPKPHIPPK